MHAETLGVPGPEAARVSGWWDRGSGAEAPHSLRSGPGDGLARLAGTPLSTMKCQDPSADGCNMARIWHGDCLEMLPSKGQSGRHYRAAGQYGYIIDATGGWCRVSVRRGI
jgi:hypothetical protein